MKHEVYFRREEDHSRWVVVYTLYCRCCGMAQKAFVRMGEDSPALREEINLRLVREWSRLPRECKRIAGTIVTPDGEKVEVLSMGKAKMLYDRGTEDASCMDVIVHSVSDLQDAFDGVVFKQLEAQEGMNYPKEVSAPYDGSLRRRRYWKKVAEK